MCAAGLGIFGLVAFAAKWNDKASRVPFVSFFTHLMLQFPIGTCLLLGSPTRAVLLSLNACTLQVPREYPYDGLKAELGDFGSPK